MPRPSADTLRRRARHRRAQRLNDLVTGRGSMRVVVKALDNKSQQQLSDRLHHINRLGKTDIGVQFKGAIAAQRAAALAEEAVQRKRRRQQGFSSTTSPTGFDKSCDYGVRAFDGLDLTSDENSDPSLALLLYAAQSAKPSRATGHIFHPQPKQIRFQRAYHPQAFEVTPVTTSSASAMGTPPETAGPWGIASGHRPCTVPAGRGARLQRKLPSRQRPLTTGADGVPLLQTELADDDGDNCSGAVPFGGAYQWAGLFATQSRPGSASTTATRITSSTAADGFSRPGTRGGVPASACASRPGTRGEVRSACSRPGTGKMSSSSRPGTGTRTGFRPGTGNRTFRLPSAYDLTPRKRSGIAPAQQSPTKMLRASVSASGTRLPTATSLPLFSTATHEESSRGVSSIAAEAMPVALQSLSPNVPLPPAVAPTPSPIRKPRPGTAGHINRARSRLVKKMRRKKKKRPASVEHIQVPLSTSPASNSTPPSMAKKMARWSSFLEVQRRRDNDDEFRASLRLLRQLRARNNLVAV